MVRIANIVIPDAFVNYINADLELLVPEDIDLSDAQILDIKNATVIEEIENGFGRTGDVIGTYALVGWRAVEKTPKGIRFTWQTYRTTELDQLRQDNEDLTAAILELAAIIGGEE